MQDAIDALCIAIHGHLSRHPLGLSEYQLIQTLQEEELLPRDRNLLGDSVTLFRTHFLVFHCLYLLDEKLSSQGQARIHIDALNIQLLQATSHTQTQISVPDKLRQYYLDITQLAETDAAEIEHMLNKFWQAYIRNDGRQQALQVLGLSDPVDVGEITACYRRLAAKHHPDRGGNEKQLQQINQAYRQLVKQAP